MRKNLFLTIVFSLVLQTFFGYSQNIKKIVDEKGSYIFTPSAVTKNYATWSSGYKSPNVLLSGGNLVVDRNGGIGVVLANIPVSSGKWYWEYKLTATGGSYDCFFGIATSSCPLNANLGANALGWSIVIDGGDYYNNGFIGFSGAGTFPASTNDVFGFELNLDNHTLTIYQNNTVLTPTPLFTGLSSFYYPAMSVQNQNVTITANFGATTFTYTNHTGFNQGIYN